MNGKSKGSGYERKVMSLLMEAFACCGIERHDAHRSVLSGGHKHSTGDIELSPRFAKIFPVSIECKWHKKLNIHSLLERRNYEEMGRRKKAHDWFYTFWEQASAAAKKGKRFPLLVFKQNGSPSLAAFPEGFISSDLLEGINKLSVEKEPRFGRLFVVPLERFLAISALDAKRRMKGSRHAGKQDDDD